MRDNNAVSMPLYDGKRLTEHGAHSPERIPTSFTLEPCPMCGSRQVFVYRGGFVLGRPTVHIECEECRTRSDWNVFNCGRWNSEAGVYLHYDEQQAIADTCRKWNTRKATP